MSDYDYSIEGLEKIWDYVESWFTQPTQKAQKIVEKRDKPVFTEEDDLPF